MTARIAPRDAQKQTHSGRAVLLDLRPPADFARGHAPGAISVPYSQRGVGARARIALPEGKAVIVVAADADTAAAALADLRSAGIDALGWLEGGHAAWRAAALPEASIGELGIEQVGGRTDATVVDVREPIEWTTGHIPGALLIPLGSLRVRIAEVPRDRPVIVICEAGIRSCVGASVLASEGYRDVAHVPAGTSGYRRSGLPLEVPAPEEAQR